MDFVYTVSPEKAKEHVLSVHDPQINVDIALSPTEGGEYKEICELSMSGQV